MGLRDTLRAAQSANFAAVSVIAVDLEGDVRSGVDYLRSLGPSFDQVSIGGAWLNELITNLVWREALAKPSVPQVLLVARRVDASRFPRDVAVGRDSLVLSVAGRDSVVEWIGRGAPLTLHAY
jgi:hypothetical protein